MKWVSLVLIITAFLFLIGSLRLMRDSGLGDGRFVLAIISAVLAFASALFGVGVFLTWLFSIA